MCNLYRRSWSTLTHVTCVAQSAHVITRLRRVCSHAQFTWRATAAHCLQAPPSKQASEQAGRLYLPLPLPAMLAQKVAIQGRLPWSW